MIPTPTTRIVQISPQVTGRLSSSSRLFNATHMGQTIMETPRPIRATATQLNTIRSTMHLISPTDSAAAQIFDRRIVVKLYRIFAAEYERSIENVILRKTLRRNAARRDRHSRAFGPNGNLYVV
jgi:hypothetical protein